VRGGDPSRKSGQTDRCSPRPVGADSCGVEAVARGPTEGKCSLRDRPPTWLEVDRFSKRRHRNSRGARRPVPSDPCARCEAEPRSSRP